MPLPLALARVFPHESPGDDEAVRFLFSRFPPQHTPKIRRESRLMAHALLDDHWPAVRRLVRVLCARPLPVRLSGPVVTRLIESALARHEQETGARPRSGVHSIHGNG